MAGYPHIQGGKLIIAAGKVCINQDCPCQSGVTACFNGPISTCLQFTTTGFTTADGCSNCPNLNRMWQPAHVGLGFGGTYWEETTTPAVILGACGGGPPNSNRGRVRIVEIGLTQCEVFAEVFSTTLLLARWSAIFAKASAPPFTLNWNAVGVTAGICNISVAQPTIVLSEC